MNDPVLKLRLLAKTELTLGRFHARRAANQAILSAVALFFVLLGLGMLNFSGYQALTVIFGPALAALFVAGADIVIGMAVLVFAARTGTNSDEEKMAKEIRDIVYTELNNDVDAVKAELVKVSDDVYRIRSGFAALSSGKFSGIFGLVPLIELLTKVVNKKKQTQKQKKT